MAEKKIKGGFELKPGTGWATAWAAAPAALAGFQAAAAQRQLGEVRTNIENYRRQDIENPFANLSNPYENLAVATQAAEMQMEQTDQALANTLDTLRETGAAAGGATAIANAALKSKQGVAASIEKQEAQNQRLQAQGQLQVDIAKGKGETIRMEAQELRDTNELNRLQSQSDMAQYTRDSAMQTGMKALGAAAGVRNAGIVLEQKDQKDAVDTPYTEEENELIRTTAYDAPKLSIAASKQDATGVSPNPLLDENGLPILNAINYPGSDSTTLSSFSKLSGIDTGKGYKDPTRIAMWNELGLNEAYVGSAEQNDKILEQQKLNYQENNLANQ